MTGKITNPFHFILNAFNSATSVCGPAAAIPSWLWNNFQNSGYEDLRAILDFINKGPFQMVLDLVTHFFSPSLLAESNINGC